MFNLEDVKAEDCLEFLFDLREEEAYGFYLEARQFLYDKYKIPDLMTDPYVRI